jgi:hypothetical protein
MIYDAVAGSGYRSSGQTSLVVATFPSLRSPTYGTGHEARRLAFANQDILFQGQVAIEEEQQFGGSFRLEYQRQIDSGSWVTFATKQPASSGSVLARYTTPNTWSTLNIRVLFTAVTGGGGIVFQGTYFTNNANQSAATADTGAGGDTGGSIGINPLPPGDWTNPAQ